MPESTHRAALRHLDLLRAERQRYRAQEVIYVQLAYAYGCEVDEISVRTGIPVLRVRQILLKT